MTGDIWPQCDGHVGTLAGWIQCSSNQIGVLQKQSERRCFQLRDHAWQQCNPTTGFRSNIHRTANSKRRYGKRQFADSPPISSSFSSYNLTTRMRCLARKAIPNINMKRTLFFAASSQHHTILDISRTHDKNLSFPSRGPASPMVARSRRYTYT